MRKGHALALSPGTVQALIPVGTPDFEEGAESPWNLKSLVRFAFFNVPSSKLLDFTSAKTGCKWMPSARTITKWSSADGGWHDVREQHYGLNAIAPSELAPTRPEPPTSETGLYAHALSGRVKDDYLALYQHEDLMSLKSDLSVVAVKIQILMQQVSAAVEQGQFAGSPGMWADIRAAYNQFNYCMSRRQTAEANLALTELGSVLERYENDSSLWAELKELINLRARLVESETKRLNHAGQFVTVAEAVKIAGERLQALTQAIEKHADPETCAAILATYQEFITGE